MNSGELEAGNKSKLSVDACTKVNRKATFYKKTKKLGFVRCISILFFPEMSATKTLSHIKVAQRKAVVKRKENESLTANDKSNGSYEEDISLFFVVWERGGAEFLKGADVRFTPENMRVHVFYSRSTPTNELPVFTTWLIGHESFTDSEDAIWVDLTAFVVGINARFAGLETCEQCSSKHRMNVIIVWGDNEKGLELKALLRANNINAKVISERKTLFVDMFKHVCRYCNLIFKDSNQADTHDKVKHNHLCHNFQCERSRRNNGFYTRDELETHTKVQRICRFCPNDVFCTDTMFYRHMKRNHDYCPCSCCEYSEREDNGMFEQYNALCPLPCLEEPACKARFSNIDAQAFHHKACHGAKYPYFCMACYKAERLVCVETSEKLLSHVQEEKHEKKDFQFAIVPRRMLELDCKSGLLML